MLCPSPAVQRQRCTLHATAGSKKELFGGTKFLGNEQCLKSLASNKAEQED
jgi:hypothetical protein